MRKLFSILLFLLACQAFGQDTIERQPGQSPPRIVLAGDSTVTDASGWGTGFKACLAEDVQCINLAKGGRSSRSYRAEGWWQKCLESKPDYLLIQFGHNDQPGKGPERESAAESDFRDHLRAYVSEAQAVGIRPVLVTSLERRRWTENGKIVPSLASYAAATRAVENQSHVPLIDLHALSIAAYEKLGPIACRAWEPMSETGADHTHLSPEGSSRVGALVAAELARTVPQLKACIKLTAVNPEVHLADPERITSELKLEETEAKITISKGDAPILVYNKQSPPVPPGIDPIYRRSGFLHPVASPAGKIVTATFPVDHAHQHGIFSAWVRTTYDGREIDFWNLAAGSGRVLHQRVVSTSRQPEHCGFKVDLIHQTVAEPVVDVLRESWEVNVYPAADNFYCFDIDSTQQALTDKPLLVQHYHYGGMALRGPLRWLQGKPLLGALGQPAPQEPNDFLNDLGSDRIEGNHQHARWVALGGLLHGQPVSIVVLSHVENFRAPQAARLHPTKPYFCFSPCVDGEFTIDKQHPLRARYRYLVTDAEPDAQWIQQQWQSWCGAE